MGFNRRKLDRQKAKTRQVKGKMRNKTAHLLAKLDAKKRKTEEEA